MNQGATPEKTKAAPQNPGAGNTPTEPAAPPEGETVIVIKEICEMEIFKVVCQDTTHKDCRQLRNSIKVVLPCEDISPQAE